MEAVAGAAGGGEVSELEALLRAEERAAEREAARHRDEGFRPLERLFPTEGAK